MPLMVTGLAALALAQAPPTPSVPACAADTTPVAAFVRGFLADLPPALAVPRGAFVLVCGGHPGWAMGFGRTAAGAEVDPGRTIFRAASNAKLVVATAVLQLAERGRWDLSDDVDRYLPPAARLGAGSFRHPVTLEALLTHTAGLDDRSAGAVSLPADRVSLARYFSRPPRRVREPGLEVSYSNVGMALAGYLVEVRSGEPFGRFAAAHVFAPLGMSRSSFDQPPPAEWAADLADGPPRGRRDVVFNPYPAASLVATPLDMGRFIAAHLNGGALDASAGGGRILAPASSALMQAPHWRPQPRVPAVALGFFEGAMNGRRTLFHTGDSGDHSLVFLLPDDGVGFYFVFSGTDEQAVLRERFAARFMDRFFPGAVSAPAPPGPAAPAVAPAELAGTYRTAAYSRGNFEKLKALIAQVVVRPGRDGGITITVFGAPRAIGLRPGGGLTFRGDSGEVVAFRRGAGGRIIGLTVTGSVWDPGSWDRVGALEDGRVHLALFLGILLTAVARLTLWPLAALVARLRRRGAAPAPGGEQRPWRWSAVAAGLLVAAPVLGFASAMLSFSHPLRAIPRAMTVLGVALAAATLVGLALVPQAVQAWRLGQLTPARRVHLSLLAAAFVLLAPLLVYWRLLPI